MRQAGEAADGGGRWRTVAVGLGGEGGQGSGDQRRTAADGGPVGRRAVAPRGGAGRRGRVRRGGQAAGGRRASICETRCLYMTTAEKTPARFINPCSEGFAGNFGAATGMPRQEVKERQMSVRVRRTQGRLTRRLHQLGIVFARKKLRECGCKLDLHRPGLGQSGPPACGEFPLRPLPS